MSDKTVGLRESHVTLAILKRFLTSVDPHVFLKIANLSKGISTYARGAYQFSLA